MNRRDSLLLSASVGLGCLILGLFLSQPSVGQSPAGSVGKTGKYQVSVAAPEGNVFAIMCDTETGQLWKYSGSGWSAMNSPVDQKKK